MGVRLFAALSPPSTAIEHLLGAVSAVRVPDDGLRWTPSERLHLTIAFFGDVAELRVDDLRARLARTAARHDAMELRFRGAGAFSRAASAQVLWCGVDGPLDKLRSVASSCAAAGRRVGIEVDDRPYRPHLTLARSRGRARVDVRSIVAALGDYVGPSWPAEHLHLMASHLGPQPRYEVVDRWPLRPAYQA
ncbi:MAG: 2,3-cyclic 3-phosphodiesterase [Actinomycetota bacterium]|jgi:2'-5' RNA ligase|nr:2,3-cyclic 3-phosphodiesterase [Actinomycetota bacterium]